jgi:hypothetical protein
MARVKRCEASRKIKRGYGTNGKDESGTALKMPSFALESFKQSKNGLKKADKVPEYPFPPFFPFFL